MHFLIVSPQGKEIELDRCVQCGAVWFDAGEVEQVSGQAVKFEPFDLEAERACPACERPMQAGVLKQAVPAERCGNCRGVFLDADDVAALKLKLTDRPHSATLVNGFVCAGCGGRFPYSEGNGTNKGLVCKTCVVNPATEKLKEGERTSDGSIFRVESDSTAETLWDLSGILDFFF